MYVGVYCMLKQSQGSTELGEKSYSVRGNPPDSRVCPRSAWDLSWAYSDVAPSGAKTNHR